MTEEIESLNVEEIRDTLNSLIKEVREMREERDDLKEKLSNIFSNNTNQGWW